MSPTLILLAALLGQKTAAFEPDVRCGSYCLYISLKALDCKVASFAEVERRLGPPSRAGYSLVQLTDVAQALGAKTLGVRTSLENLERRPGRFACIAHLDGKHFVNIASVQDGKVTIIDPPHVRELPADTLRARWSGDALLLSAEDLIPEESLPRLFPWRHVGVIGSVCLVTGVALVLARRTLGRQRSW